MSNSIKIIRPKANSLVDLPAFLQFADVVKNQVLGNALSDLMETETFPPPVQKFFELPKFKELVESLKEGTLVGESLQSKEIHTLQLLLESFHKLVHLDYDYEEIEHPVVQAKVLEQNIQDYLTCIDLFIPYDGKIINEILSELFQSVHFFSDKLKSTVLENGNFFSSTLIEFMKSEVVSLLIHLDRTNYNNLSMEDWYPVAIELGIDAKLGNKKRELSVLAKGNAHKILNQLQTIIADMSRIYLRNPPKDIGESVKTIILHALAELPSNEKLSGQKVNELFYLEFWKEPYALLLTKESTSLSKLQSLTHQLLPLKMSLYTLINDYGFVLPESFSKYINEMIRPLEFMLSILGKPNLIGAELAIGFYNSQLEYLNEMLSSPSLQKIPSSCNEKLKLIFPTLISFLETYYAAEPLTSFHVFKDSLENFFPGDEAFNHYSIDEIKGRLEQTFLQYIPTENPPFNLLEAGLSKITLELRFLLKDIDPESIEHRILQEKLFSLERIDLPSYAQTWHTIGEMLGVIYIYMSAYDNKFIENLENNLKNLFSPIFFQALFGPSSSE